MEIYENGIDDQPLFSPELLKQIDWESRISSFKNDISPQHPGESLILRPLQADDYDKGYLNILKQLTSVGDVSRKQFRDQFEAMRACKNTYYITVLEDTTTGQIIGTSSLIIEHKFIHSAGSRGRIEDVVVDDTYRGRQLGKLLVETMTLLGKQVGVYKMSLECKDQNIPFYENFGYKVDVGNNFMIQRYKD